MQQRLSILFIYLSIQLAMAAVTQQLSKEGAALIGLKGKLVDVDGHLDNWKEAATGSGAAVPAGILNPCSWTGIKCSRLNSSVISLDLSSMSLTGSLSGPDLGQLKNLVNISVDCNNLTGDLPAEIVTLPFLQYINVSNNNFSNYFPSNFSQLQNLQVLDCFNNNFSGPLPPDLWKIPSLKHLSLAGNYFDGNIPVEYGNFPSLVYLAISGNSLTGVIPEELGNLSELEELYMGYYNTFLFDIPASFGNLTKLVRLDLGECGLNGSLPIELGNLVNLDSLFLQLNSFTGAIPSEFGNLVNLKSLDLSYNNLTGEIPPTLVYLQKLELLSLMNNQIEGTIPACLGDLPNLQVLYLWKNKLVGTIPQTLGQNTNLTLLDLSSNFLNGTIPQDLCIGQKLEWLILQYNQLTGPIPESLGNCQSLTKLRLSYNLLNGSIPTGLLGLPNISMVEVKANNITGPIPSTFISAPLLGYFDFSDNYLSSSLPASIGNLPNLQQFLLSGNQFSGLIPPQICDMPLLNKLDLSLNNFSGPIPSTISNCKKLGSLDLSWNNLSGEIPLQIEYIPDLYLLNLSHNHLSGQIPPQLQLVQTLSIIDFSYNNLSGQIPHFDSTNISAFVGNPFLCGDVLPSCNLQSSAPAPSLQHPKQHDTGLLSWLVGVLFSAAFIVLLVGMCCFFRKYHWYICRYFQRKPTVRPWKLTAFQRLDFSATEVLDCLTEDNIIGRGGAGTVYKGVMPSGEIVAVKRLSGEGKGASHDHGFSAEIQTLGKIRHRNIVRLLGCCSNHETNLLVYEYMPKGSLGELLHSKEKSGHLDWDTRYNVALQAAHGLCYLHHDCSPLIVHRDVKSNNILLDDNFQAHVADFGLAKFFQGTGKSESMSSIAGSYGYIAPEYAYTLKVNEKSDIYSFGVVLMELLTGNRPIEPDFGDGVDIVQWVRRKIQTKDGVLDILDPRMSGVGVPLQEVMLVLRVALLCSSDLPADRPTMRDVVQMLSDVKPKSKGSSLADSRELMMASDLLKKNDNLQLTVCEQK
ncbi:unnamed protein product [Sphagnum compactum]